MFSLIWFIFLLSFLDIPCSTTSMEKRMKRPSPSSSVTQTDSLKRPKSDDSSPGSFDCYARTISRDQISERVSNACHKAERRLLRGGPFHDIPSVAGYYVWTTSVSPSYEKNSFSITIYQDKERPARCFVRNVYIETDTDYKICYEFPLRHLKFLIESIPTHASFKCDEATFSALEVRKAMRKASKVMDFRRTGLSKSRSLYPEKFADRIFFFEDDLWMYPILQGGKIYNEGHDAGRYFVVIRGNGNPAGVVHERSLLQKHTEKNLDHTMDYHLCPMSE